MRHRRPLALGATFLTVLGLTAGGAATAHAAPVNPVVQSQVGFSGHAELYGWGAATLRDGSVVIGDYWNMRVQHFATDGTRLPDYINNPGYAPDQDQAPYGLAVDKNDGSFYMADTDQYAIKKYDEAGQWLFNFGVQCKTAPCPSTSFKYPRSVAVASDGRVIVVDTWDNRISLHDPTTGVELSRFGSFGAGNGQFKSPHAIAVDTIDGVEYLFVADTTNKRVQQLTLDGTWIRNIGSPGSRLGQFKGDLRGVAVDTVAHKMYVVDAFANRVNVYDTITGLPETRFGTTGQAPGQFYDGGREATVDGDGNVWVGDLPNFRVQKFQGYSRTGTQPALVGSSLLVRPDPAAPPADGGLNSPRGVTLDAVGNSYVVDTYNQRIQKYAPDGSYLAKFGLRGNGNGDFSYPRLLSYSAVDDTIVVADSGNYAIKKFRAGNLPDTTLGTVVWSVGTQGTGANAPLNKFNQPQAVTVAPDGLVYVADSLNGRVVVLAADGTPIKQISSKGLANGQMQYPRALTIDPLDGSLWVVDSQKKRVLHFNVTTGEWLGQFGKAGSLPNQFQGPFGIAADADNLYVADAQDHVIKVVTRAGVAVTQFGGLGEDLGHLQTPNGLAIAPDGRLFVAEQKNDRISVWTLH